LWLCDPQDIKTLPWFQDSAWFQFQLDSTGKYLGFFIGPWGTAEKNFKKAMDKFESRCETWVRLGCGLQDNIIIFNTMCLSVLSFVAQLVNVPEPVVNRIKYWKQRFARGPWNWLLDTDLDHLSGLGFRAQTKDLSVVAAAAQLRVVHGPGGLSAGTLLRRREGIEKCRRDCDDLILRSAHTRWVSHAPTQTILSTMERLRDTGMTKACIHELISSKDMEAESSESKLKLIIKIRKQFQSTAARTIAVAISPFDWEARIRAKLELLLHRNGASHRVSRLHAVRTQRNLHTVCKLLPPRVAFASLHTIFNGWCTGERFGMRRLCPLCRRVGALGVRGKDSLHHVPHCIITKKLCSMLGLEFQD